MDIITVNDSQIHYGKRKNAFEILTLLKENDALRVAIEDEEFDDDIEEGNNRVIGRKW